MKRIIGDGVADSVNQKLKLLVTDNELVVNTKGQPEYRVRNCAQIALTSNYYDCIKLDQDDRRACVIHWGPISDAVDYRGNQDYWQKYVAWLEGDGPSALYQYLLEWDCSGFDPHAWAPFTPEKEAVTEASMMPMELWMKDLFSDSENHLPLVSAGRALWTAKELAVLYYSLSEEEITQGQLKAITNGLRNQGFKQAAEGAPLRPHGREGAQARYWIIRSKGLKDWKDATKCLKHLKQFF